MRLIVLSRASFFPFSPSPPPPSDILLRGQRHRSRTWAACFGQIHRGREGGSLGVKLFRQSIFRSIRVAQKNDPPTPPPLVPREPLTEPELSPPPAAERLRRGYELGFVCSSSRGAAAWLPLATNKVVERRPSMPIISRWSRCEHAAFLSSLDAGKRPDGGFSSFDPEQRRRGRAAPCDRHRRRSSPWRSRAKKKNNNKRKGSLAT